MVYILLTFEILAPCLFPHLNLSDCSLSTLALQAAALSPRCEHDPFPPKHHSHIGVVNNRFSVTSLVIFLIMGLGVNSHEEQETANSVLVSTS